MTAQVIMQVEGEFRATGLLCDGCVTFLEGIVSCKSTINLYFTMPATFIFTKFVPNKLNIYATLP